MSNDFTWGPLLEQLELVLRKYDLRDHLKLLAHFRAGYESQLRKLNGMPRPPWTTATIVNLAAIFQLQPFHDFYPVLPRDNRCPHCRADLSAAAVANVRAVLPDRTLHYCRHCSGRWLVVKA